MVYSCVMHESTKRLIRGVILFGCKKWLFGFKILSFLVPRYDDASGNPYSGVLYGSFWCLTSWIPVDFGGYL